MSIYEGTPVEQSYAHGFDEGRVWGDQDVLLGLGTITNWLIQTRSFADNAITREGRAYHLGELRGYREIVRTLNNGRWGT